ncbi:NAD-dependent epimerase/dehydratase family protein [Gorillibacterium sp. sgz500922]|uniref:NAD-dependent epimerase/dehydratase family protein n=1 Tax=Gorillibacterium sp. sgz500922 TaxID=3446694 RepID=UPI003F665B44
MDLYNSRTYMQDLDDAIDQLTLIKQMDAKSVLVTGATGLICSAIVDLLLHSIKRNGSNIKVYAAGRSEEKFNKRFSKYVGEKYLEFVPYDASKKNYLNFSCDYVIHGASNAYPSAIQAKPVETMIDNFVGMKELLDYAEQEKVINTVFISSSEIYGKKENSEPFKEEEYSYIDILNPRSSYPISKLAAETLCTSYYYEKKVPVSIIRPGHIYGPTASRSDNRISSAFAFDVVDGKDLVMKSDGSQIRSYCYMIDCATAILTILISGKPGEAYNVSNPESIMTIKEIAECFAKYGGTKLLFELPSTTEKAAFNPMSNSSLNSDKLQMLGWKGMFDSQLGTEHTIRVIMEAQGEIVVEKDLRRLEK